jgi:hypothetical protein
MTVIDKAQVMRDLGILYESRLAVRKYRDVAETYTVTKRYQVQLDEMILALEALLAE